MCYNETNERARPNPTTIVMLVVATILLTILLLSVAYGQSRGAQQYTTLPDGEVRNEAGQNVGKWERDSSGTVRFRDGRTGKLSDWKVERRPDGGTTFVPSPFKMPPKHPGLP